MKPISRWAAAGLLACSGTFSGVAGADAARVDQLAWLSGCWGFDTADGAYEETWTTPTGNSMLGVSRRTAGGYTREFEYMRIVTSGGGGFDLIAQPNGNDETRFNSVSFDDTQISFDNPTNDFPTRIVYERDGADALNARIEGTHQGHPMVQRFPLKRRTCP